MIHSIFSPAELEVVKLLAMSKRCNLKRMLIDGTVNHRRVVNADAILNKILSKIERMQDD